MRVTKISVWLCFVLVSTSCASGHESTRRDARAEHLAATILSVEPPSYSLADFVEDEPQTPSNLLAPTTRRDVWDAECGDVRRFSPQAAWPLFVRATGLPEASATQMEQLIASRYPRLQAIGVSILEHHRRVTGGLTPSEIAQRLEAELPDADPVQVATILAELYPFISSEDLFQALTVFVDDWPTERQILAARFVEMAFASVRRSPACAHHGGHNFGPFYLAVAHLRVGSQAGREIAVVTEDVYYCYPPTGAVVRVPRGYETDFLSIPSIAQFVFRSRDHLVPALVHDWLYSVGADGETGRQWADEVFLFALGEYGAPYLARSVMYRAVRLGGGESFGAPAEWRFVDLETLEPLNPSPERPNSPIVGYLDCAEFDALLRRNRGIEELLRSEDEPD